MNINLQANEFDFGSNQASFPGGSLPPTSKSQRIFRNLQEADDRRNSTSACEAIAVMT